MTRRAQVPLTLGRTGHAVCSRTLYGDIGRLLASRQPGVGEAASTCQLIAVVVKLAAQELPRASLPDRGVRAPAGPGIGCRVW